MASVQHERGGGAAGEQSQIVKWKWGHPVSEWPISDARAPSNSPSARIRSRPTSVRRRASPRNIRRRAWAWEEVIRQSFTDAKDYIARWDDYEAKRKRGETPIPPRHDILMETMVDILKGKIDVHSHCYRADEIMMLPMSPTSRASKIRELQHVLEGLQGCQGNRRARGRRRHVHRLVGIQSRGV